MFLWVRDYLLKENDFTTKKKSLFRNDVCSLVSLISLGLTSISKLEENDILIGIFTKNMFKVQRFDRVLDFMRNDISPKISEMIARENINETEISSLCHSEDNKHTKREVEALILSFSTPSCISMSIIS